MSARHLAAIGVSALLLSGPAVRAQDTSVAFGGISQDPGQPVEVSADSLAVNQADGTARFTGNVVIGQGEMRLAAPEVMVVYREGGGSIARLNATGGVTLKSGAEAAEAESADYDIDAGTITMQGDVLLTQGENALSAQEMVVDLENGTARMSGRVRTVIQTGEP